MQSNKTNQVVGGGGGGNTGNIGNISSTSVVVNNGPTYHQVQSTTQPHTMYSIQSHVEPFGSPLNDNDHVKHGTIETVQRTTSTTNSNVVHGHTQPQQISNGHHHNQHHHHQQQQQQSTYSVPSSGPTSMINAHHQTSHNVSFNIVGHTDDENDLFQCGKCQQQFCQLQQFMQHKHQCNISINNNNSNNNTKNNVRINSTSSTNTVMPHLHHTTLQSGQQQQPSTVLSDDIDFKNINLSQLIIQNVTPTHLSQPPTTSILASSDQLTTVVNQTSTSQSTQPHSHQTSHHLTQQQEVHQRQQEQQQQNRHQTLSPTLTEAIGGHNGGNSNFSETDLLSLTPSLDAQMMIGNHSISPTSLMHLQGADISANTDDFAQFRLSPTPTQSPQSNGTSNGVTDTARNNSMIDSLYPHQGVPELVHPSIINPNQSTNIVSHHQDQSSFNSLVNSFVVSDNSSPSFATFLRTINASESTDSVTGNSVNSISSKLKSSFSDSGTPLEESNETSNSIGSPSRFLNMGAPPSINSSISATSQPTSTSESTIRSSNVSSMVGYQKSVNQHKQATSQQHQQSITNHVDQPTHTLTVIQSSQPHQQKSQTTLKNIKKEEEDAISIDNTSSTTKSSCANNESTGSTLKTPSSKVSKLSTNCLKTSLPLSYQCKFCDRAYAKNTDLQTHMPCHTGEKPFQCLQCGKAFTQRSNLRKHIQTHKIPRDDMRNIYKQSLDAMVQNPTIIPGLVNNTELSEVDIEVVEFPLDLPQNVTPGPSKVSTQHGSTSVPNRVDNLAKIEFGQNQQNQSEILFSTFDVRLTTNDIPTTQSNSLQQSSMVQSTLEKLPKKEQGNRGNIDLRSFVCPIESCGFWASGETELKEHFTDEHVKTSNVEKGVNLVYKCYRQGCDVTVPDVGAFLHHLQTHDAPIETNENSKSRNHIPKSRTYRCEICLNRYTTIEALKQHKETTSHHFPCDKCDKIFPCERYLRRHSLTHGAVLYNCKFCEKSFKTSNYLKVHLVIHTGEKPFTCGQCDAAFNRRDKLKRHELVHDPIKRYKCPLLGKGCTREFNRPDKLKAHILTHTGVKPYQCTSCDRSFTRRAHLREHMKTHPGLEESDLQVNKNKKMRIPISKLVNDLLEQSQSPAYRGVLSPFKKFKTSLDETHGIITETEDDDEDDEEDEDSSDDIQLMETKPKLIATTSSFTTISTDTDRLVVDSSKSSLSSSKNNKQPITTNSFILLSDNMNDILGTTTTTTNETINGSRIIIGPPPTITSTQATGNNVSSGTANSSQVNLNAVVQMDQLKFLNGGNFVLVFPCGQCDTIFMTESEHRSHQCVATNNSDPSSNNNNHNNGNISLLIGSQISTQVQGTQALN